MVRLDRRNSMLSQGVLAVYWGKSHGRQRAVLTVYEETRRYFWPWLQLENRINPFGQIRMRNLLHPERERHRRAKWRSVSSQPHFFAWQSEGSHDTELSNVLRIRVGEAGEVSCPTVHWRHSDKSILMDVFTLKKDCYTGYTETKCSPTLLLI